MVILSPTRSWSLATGAAGAAGGGLGSEVNPPPQPASGRPARRRPRGGRIFMGGSKFVAVEVGGAAGGGVAVGLDHRLAFAFAFAVWFFVVVVVAAVIGGGGV